MNEVYIKISDLAEYDIKNLEKVGIKSDIISIGTLLEAIDTLIYENDKLEEEIDELRHPEDYKETFDYSEWKANQE